jgi:hypothetical protein
MFTAQLLLASAVLATPPAVDVVGFSPDDRYVAYVEHGVGEGSGLPWARLVVVDVRKSLTAVPPLEVSADPNVPDVTEAATVEKARALLLPVQKKLRVKSWVPARALALGENGELQEKSGAPLGNLEVKTSKARKGGACEPPFVPQLLKGTLFLMGDDGPRTLLAEKAPPTGRRCSSGCRVHAVYAQGKAVLGLAACKVPGFEGSAESLTPMTGILAYGLDEPLPAPAGLE